MKTRQVTVPDVISVSYPENIRPNGKVEGLEFDMLQTRHLLHSILSRLDTTQLMAIYEDMHGDDKVPVNYDNLTSSSYPMPESERLIP
jgi:hypothetical protein